MKVLTPEISWHAKDPIYSADFQYVSGDIYRFATCGTDRNIRMWHITEKGDGLPDITFLSNLSRHTRTVNVVRFSPDGQTLASAGDDSSIMLWKRNDLSQGANNLFQEDEEENKETWSVFKVLRSHLEDVYDLSWSKDGKHLMSGSVDNTAILWDVKKGHKLWIFTEHKSFVQGVAFDPQEQFMATMSCDRACRIYHFKSRTLSHTISKLSIPNTNNNLNEKPKPFRMFLDDALKSFFRRLSFSPDGNILVVPSGCLEKGQGDKYPNVTYVFKRTNFKTPVLYLPGSDKASLAVRFSPVLYQLRSSGTKSSTESKESQDSKKTDSLFGLPYRMIYAIVTEDSVVFYDTQQQLPFAHVTDIHYHQLSDLTWSHDGKYLVITSTDGYCTIVTFKDGELGTPYEEQVVKVKSRHEIQQEIEEKNKSGLIKSGKHKKARKDGKRDDEMETSPDNSGIETGKSLPNGHSAMETESSDTKPTSRITCENASANQKSEIKAPRRIQVTTLCSVPGPSSSPKTGDKPARRIQVTTLSTPTKGDTSKTLTDRTNSTPTSSGAANDKGARGTPTSSKDTTPRRVQLKTLTTKVTTPEDEASLHLVLEETSDVTQLTEQKLSLTSDSNLESSPTPSKDCASEKTVTPSAKRENKTPRRIQPVLLQSPSTSK